MTPEAGDGTSLSALSVATSTIGWSFLTESPSLTNHLVIVPSTTLSPSCGITTFTAIAVILQKHTPPDVQFVAGSYSVRRRIFNGSATKELRIRDRPLPPGIRRPTPLSP